VVTRRDFGLVDVVRDAGQRADDGAAPALLAWINARTRSAAALRPVRDFDAGLRNLYQRDLAQRQAARASRDSAPGPLPPLLRGDPRAATKEEETLARTLPAAGARGQPDWQLTLFEDAYGAEAVSAAEAAAGAARSVDLWDVQVATAVALHFSFEQQDGSAERRRTLEDFVEVLCESYPPARPDVKRALCALRAQTLGEVLDGRAAPKGPPHAGSAAGGQAKSAGSTGRRKAMKATGPVGPALADAVEAAWTLGDTPWSDYRLGWRSCRGTWPGTRGYTCGVWLLLHALAANAPSDVAAVDVLWRTRDWIQELFGCAECAEHYARALRENGWKSVRTKRGVMLTLWAAHNDVNRAIGIEAERAAAGSGSGIVFGDPEFPKIQWPSKAACPACWKPQRRPDGGRPDGGRPDGGRGGRVDGDGMDARMRDEALIGSADGGSDQFNPGAVARFLASYYGGSARHRAAETARGPSLGADGRLYLGRPGTTSSAASNPSGASASTGWRTGRATGTLARLVEALSPDGHPLALLAIALLAPLAAAAALRGLGGATLLGARGRPGAGRGRPGLSLGQGGGKGAALGFLEKGAARRSYGSGAGGASAAGGRATGKGPAAGGRPAAAGDGRRGPARRRRGGGGEASSSSSEEGSSGGSGGGSSSDEDRGSQAASSPAEAEDPFAAFDDVAHLTAAGQDGDAS
jgi:hypothetical protein